MPNRSLVSPELAATIKRELQVMPLRRVQELHPELRPGSIQGIKYGHSHADVEPRGPVGVGTKRPAGGYSNPKSHKPTSSSRAFQFSRSERVPKTLRPEERAAYQAQVDQQRRDDEVAESAARIALATEHLRLPYLVRLSVVVGLEPAEDDSLLAMAAEAAARQVLGMRGPNRGWAVDAIERVR